MEWTGYLRITKSDNEEILPSGQIDVHKYDKDLFGLQILTGDMDTETVIYMTKKECEELSDKLKDIVKED